MARVYRIWLVGFACTCVGAQTLGFGLVWYAARFGPAPAAAVLSAQIAARVLCTLPGGAWGDRFGPLRTTAAAGAVFAALAGATAAAVSLAAPGPLALVLVAAVLGAVDGVHTPATGAVPKLLAAPGELARALAARQVAVQGAALAGPALGGAAIGLFGLPAAFAAGALGHLGMLAVLAAVRRDLRRGPDTGAEAGPTDAPAPPAGIRAGAAVVLAAPLLRAIVLVTAAFAAFVIPFTSLLVPLLAGERGWDAATAGTAAGAHGAGMAAVTALVLWRGALRRAGAAAALGMLAAGTAMAAAAFADRPAAFLLCSFAVGVGTGVFSTHVGPVFVAGVPREAIGRAQAVITLAQWLPLLAANPAIGALAQGWGAAGAALLWGGGAAAAGAAALAGRGFRAAEDPGADTRPIPGGA